MRASAAIDAIGGLLISAAVVAYFSPRPGSSWGNTFFGIPYSIAIIAVPAVASASAAFARITVFRKWSNPPFGPWARGFRVGLVSFGLYAIFHVIAYTLSSVVHGGFWGLADGAAFGFAMFVFGSVFFLPPVCAVMAACEWLSSHVAP